MVLLCSFLDGGLRLAGVDLDEQSGYVVSSGCRRIGIVETVIQLAFWHGGDHLLGLDIRTYREKYALYGFTFPLLPYIIYMRRDIRYVKQLTVAGQAVYNSNIFPE